MNTGQLAGRNTNQNAAFAHNELSLHLVDIYGFDFDFTLVEYTGEVLQLIFEKARDRLVHTLSV